MDQPTCQREFDERALRNARVEGGCADLSVVVPCPFCAAGEWAWFPLNGMAKAMQKSRTCPQCERTARFLARYVDGQLESFELVLTGGPDAPEWMHPVPRRVSTELLDALET